mmetsp:Transcript_14406/g.45121  ORF Transcript_14406/g.45121 Transcript_14406/m.45121 type:complete len:369 (+) Transcript_14406:119-1225(+)
MAVACLPDASAAAEVALCSSPRSSLTSAAFAWTFDWVSAAEPAASLRSCSTRPCSSASRFLCFAPRSSTWRWCVSRSSCRAFARSAAAFSAPPLAVAASARAASISFCFAARDTSAAAFAACSSFFAVAAAVLSSETCFRCFAASASLSSLSFLRAAAPCCTASVRFFSSSDASFTKESWTSLTRLASCDSFSSNLLASCADCVSFSSKVEISLAFCFSSLSTPSAMGTAARWESSLQRELTSTSLTLAHTSTRIARLANSSAWQVSCALSSVGDMQTSSEVLQFPESAGSRRRVSLLSRKGTCFFWEARACTTLPRASRLPLMLMASFICWPATPLRFTRSDPARSTTVSTPSVALALLLPLSFASS